MWQHMPMTTSHDIHDSIELQHQQMREARSHTARIRAALRDLPTDLAGEGWDSTNTEKRRIREDLQEIMGSAVHIADMLGIEL
jgi:hypothetical protein